MIKDEEDLLVSFGIVKMISSFTAKIRFKNCKDIKEREYLKESKKIRKSVIPAANR